MHGALAKLSHMYAKQSKSTHFQQKWDRLFRSVLPREPNVLKLKQAVPTRWNSRYDQIERAFKVRKVYDAITSPETGEADLQCFHLSEEEWKLLEWLNEMLHALSMCSHAVSLTTSVSLSLMIPLFTELINTMEDNIDHLESREEAELRKEAIKHAKDKLLKYYTHTLHNPWYTFAMSE